MNTVHDEIIRRGFREVGRRRGAIRYTRGQEEILHRDFGPNLWQAHNPDSNRHVLQYFRNGRKVSGGTAWYAILTRVVDEQPIT